MQSFQFAEMAHGQHAAAKDGHGLLLGEMFASCAAVADLLQKSVRVVLEVLHYFELL